ncbi:protein of unknown function [Candidatus Filomicrobium marinum]|uniref:Uncharacterized protein n=1 Tax=Candidatus Filomicrobium marinum TaxID=1608628 RepID=A0A0D6JAP7_9HYPH|nr:protein of unknown function [Candidatus Filomicrobium marinum]CPR14830.1 protein of unknown function [Candidatus Filomicrobium marinum]
MFLSFCLLAEHRQRSTSDHRFPGRRCFVQQSRIRRHARRRYLLRSQRRRNRRPAVLEARGTSGLCDHLQHRLPRVQCAIRCVAPNEVQREVLGVAQREVQNAAEAAEESPDREAWRWLCADLALIRPVSGSSGITGEASRKSEALN